jgi:hypothetical protein
MGARLAAFCRAGAVSTICGHFLPHAGSLPAPIWGAEVSRAQVPAAFRIGSKPAACKHRQTGVCAVLLTAPNDGCRCWYRTTVDNGNTLAPAPSVREDNRSSLDNHCLAVVNVKLSVMIGIEATALCVSVASRARCACGPSCPLPQEKTARKKQRAVFAGSVVYVGYRPN